MLSEPVSLGLVIEKSTLKLISSSPKGFKYLRISETNISYKGRTFDEGKKISWKDGFRALYTILKVRIFY